MSRNGTSNLSQHHLQHYFYQVAWAEIQVSVPVTFQLLPSNIGALDITFSFRIGRQWRHQSYVGWKCGQCVARVLEDWRNRVVKYIMNYLELQIRILATATYCTSDLHYLALKPRYDGARAIATALLPQKWWTCAALPMPCLTCGELVLWKTAFPGQSMQHFHEIYSLGFLRDHLWTWKCNKNGATEPSWVKIRSSTGPWETRVPAAPVQLLLLRVPVSAASWTATRKVEELQSSSRTALSVVHVLTEMISWPRQSSPSIQHGTAQKHNSKGCSYIWLSKSFHTLNWIVVKLPGLVDLSCESWCVAVLVTGGFSSAAAGPAELFRITRPPPYCMRFFATSALEGTSSVRDHCRWLILKAPCANRSKNGKFSTKKLPRCGPMSTGCYP